MPRLQPEQCDESILVFFDLALSVGFQWGELA